MLGWYVPVANSKKMPSFILGILIILLILLEGNTNVIVYVPNIGSAIQFGDSSWIDCVGYIEMLGITHVMRPLILLSLPY
jgi:hypothetical protein